MTIYGSNDVAVADFIGAMPKVELHLHLEGSVQPSTLLTLAARHQRPLPARTEAELSEWFRFRDFSHFIQIYQAIGECLREPEDFALLTSELGAEAARQNIRYLEIHFNPEPHYRKRGIPFPDLLAGMNQGRAEARTQWGVEMRWIADGVRDAESGPISVDRTVEWIAGLDPSHGVIGLGLGGHEVGNPPGQFAAPFARAREAGLRVVAHAGETTGPETIWGSLHELQAERIGHGIRAIDDPVLVSHLATAAIPLEVCLTSNLCTGVVAGMSDHPLRRLDEAGVTVTVNSDDPPLFGTTLTDEYQLLPRAFGYGLDDVERIALNAVRVSFLPDAEKTRLLTMFTEEYAALRARLGLPPAGSGAV